MKKSLLITFITILIVLIGGYFIYGYIKENNNSNVTFNLDNYCDFNEEECIINHDKFNIKFVYNDYNYSTMTINNKIVSSSEKYTEFNILGDILIIEEVNYYPSLLVFDSKGNKILNLEDLNKQYPGMRFGDNGYVVNENKIIFEGTRYTRDEGIISVGNDKYMDFCDAFEKDEEEKQYYIEKDLNIIVSAKFEIEYLDNGKFSEIKEIEHTLLKDDDAYYCSVKQ